MKRNIFRAVQSTISVATQSAFTIRAALLFAAFVAQMGVAVPLHARQDEATAPPPPRIFTEAEKGRLAAVIDDRRKRLRLSLELAEARLARAEQFTTGQQYAAASAELGAYEALIEDAFAFMQEQGVVNNKLRDLFKRFEQALRAHTQRIEAVRRITPTAYSQHVGTTIKLAKSLRSKALDAFFGEGSMSGDDASPDGAAPDRESRASTPRPPTGN